VGAGSLFCPQPEATSKAAVAARRRAFAPKERAAERGEVGRSVAVMGPPGAVVDGQGPEGVACPFWVSKIDTYIADERL